MKSKGLSLKKLAPNHGWAKLPLFDRSKWQRVKFGDVVRVCKEQTDPNSGEIDRYVAGEHMETENVHIRQWGTVGDGYLGPAFIRRFRKGQVLYGSRRTYLKKVAVAEWDGVTSNTTLVLEADEKRLLQRLLPWLMLSDRFTKHSVAESKGSTNPYINWPDIAKFEFDLPPLDQQRRIAEILWASDELKVKWNSLLKIMREILWTRADQLLWDTGTKSSRTYGDITKRITYGFTNPMPTTDKGPWMLTAKDVLDGRIDYTTARHTSDEAYEKLLTAKSRPRIGDILLTKDGTIGRVAVVDQPDTCISQSVALIEPNPDVALSEFVAWSLRSKRMQKKLADDAGGSAIKHIYITKVATTSISVPSIEDQKVITTELDHISSAIDKIEHQNLLNKKLNALLINKLS